MARIGSSLPAAAKPATRPAPSVLRSRPVQTDVTVILVTRDRPALLAEALQALEAQTVRPRAIVVVDNASGPETAQVLSASNAVVVRSETNDGGAGGFARGVQRALDMDASWMWLMDDDAIPRPTALEELQSRLPSLPASAAVVCSCVMEFDAIATMHRRQFNGLVGLERPFPCAAYSADMVEIDTGSFVGFMVSAAAVRAVGLPDADFFVSYDDTEYSLRLRRSGYSLWLVPASVIDHRRTKTSRLRAMPFGPRHYFNVRNRIIVKRAYSRFGTAGAVLGALFGIALWVRSPGRLTSASWLTLVISIADGLAGRLGPLPERLHARKPA